jgi:hypothetical protein
VFVGCVGDDLCARMCRVTFRVCRVTLMTGRGPCSTHLGRLLERDNENGNTRRHSAERDFSKCVCVTLKVGRGAPSTHLGRLLEIDS